MQFCWVERGRLAWTGHTTNKNARCQACLHPYNFSIIVIFFSFEALQLQVVMMQVGAEMVLQVVYIIHHRGRPKLVCGCS